MMAHTYGRDIPHGHTCLKCAWGFRSWECWNTECAASFYFLCPKHRGEE